MKRVMTAFAVAALLSLPVVGGAAAASNAQGCPGNGASAQANAGLRNELVAAAKDAARAAGGNFGEVQSGYNHTVCDNGNGK